uniref:Uncharacterized protein n=1 Tax=Chrysotila carterae TaxID=13221 RepID=A0A7S4EVR0_CHRCT
MAMPCALCTKRVQTPKRPTAFSFSLRLSMHAFAFAEFMSPRNVAVDVRFEAAFCRAQVKRILFDEGGTWENMFKLMHRDFRPGHWGVFHLAHFKVGAAGTFRMAELLSRPRADFSGCGSFRNPFSPAGEPPCPLAFH